MEWKQVEKELGVKTSGKGACFWVTQKGAAAGLFLPSQGLLQGLGQAVQPSDGSWAQEGFSLPPGRLQLGHTWLQQGEAPVAWKQHLPSPEHLCVLSCCHHTPSTYPPPTSLNFLPPALPCPHSPTLLSLPAFPEASPALPLPPAFLQPTHHQFYTLPQLSHSLFQAPVFPRSCLDVSLFSTLNKPILPNRPISFPTWRQILLPITWSSPSCSLNSAFQSRFGENVPLPIEQRIPEVSDDVPFLSPALLQGRWQSSWCCGPLLACFNEGEWGTSWCWQWAQSLGRRR